MKIFGWLLAMTAFAGTASAGQTGAFQTTIFRTWACTTQDAMANVMAEKSPSAMRKRAAGQGNCFMVPKGKSIWTHGGNALIEWGGIEGFEGSLYYPAIAVTLD